MTAQPAKDTFLATDSSDAAAAWDDLLKVQVDLFLEDELLHLARSPAWQRARSVTDVGCGNGYYLSRIGTHAPEKAFLGVDISAELIDLAQSRHNGPNLRFERLDFLTQSVPPSDILLLRFVLQHLTDLAAVLSSARRSLRHGGTVLVIEPDLASSSTSPPLPMFGLMLASFEEQRKGDGVLRNDISRLARRVRQMPGWRVVSDVVVRVQRRGPFHGTPTAGALHGWADICRRVPGFEFPVTAVHREIEDWSRAPGAECDMGLRLVELTCSADVGDA